MLKALTVEALVRTPMRLLDRDLFPFPTASTDRLDLRMGPRTATFFKLTASAAENPEWGVSPNAEAGDAAVQIWMAQLARLKTGTFLGRNAALPEAAVLEATLTAKDQPPVTLRLLEQQDESWLAASTHTRHGVRLNGKQVGALIESARALLQVK